MIKRRLLILLSVLLSLSLLAGCAKDSENTTAQSNQSQEDGTAENQNNTEGGSSSTENNASSSNTTSSDTTASAISQIDPGIVTFDADDAYLDWTAANTITLNGDSIETSGGGMSVDGSTVTITSSGDYLIEGTLNNGSIIVNSSDSGTVRLILNGVTIHCENSSPIYIMEAGKTVISLEKGTENYLSDTADYIFESADDDEPDAVIFSKDDLTINGEGTLHIEANYGNGITSKDDLRIMSGTFNITAANNAIKGKDLLAIKGGTFNLEAQNDGLKATNSTDADKGLIYIESGTFNITAACDGVQAETSLFIYDGDFTISTGGGSENSSSSSDNNSWGSWGNETTDTSEEDTSSSAKGLKADNEIVIYGGTYEIDSSDDSIHCNGVITIEEADISITSGDDGIHADSSLTIENGTILISKSYEGLEADIITINNGTINITSSDDGINVAGGNDSSSMSGRPGENSFNSSGSSALYINGGYIVVDASGDGLDANGSIIMTGGTVIVNGPTSSADGALDFDGSFTISGGLLIAAGSSGMLQYPGSLENVYGIVYSGSSLEAQTLVNISDSAGNDIVTFAPAKSYQSVIICSPDLENGATYTLSTGGSSTGTETDGLYTGGTYSGGTQVEEFTITDSLTYIGTSSTTSPGGGGGGNFPNDSNPRR